MTKQITISAYVIAMMGEHKIIVRVDEKYAQLISDLFSKIYQKNTFKDTIVLNVKNARFSISVPWTNLDSLIGMHVKVTTNVDKYFFWSTKEYPQEDGSTRSITEQRKGVSFRVKNIKNMTIDDE